VCTVMRFNGMQSTHEFMKFGVAQDCVLGTLLFITQTATDTPMVITEGEQDAAPKLSNDTSFNDLEWSVSQILRSRYYSTSNN